MATYKTPGVYVEEQSILPPSVAGVSTAVPAFIGYTEKALQNGVNMKNKPVKIGNMLEYETIFGKAAEVGITVNEAAGTVAVDDLKFLMYYSLNMYFKNGGGPCYIVSVGDYSTAPAKADLLAGLDALKGEDEPTLILFTDAVKLPGAADYYEVCNASLQQCSLLKDRFAIFDVLNGDTDCSGFRGGIAGDLKYGAAYHPHVNTSLNYLYDDAKVKVGGVTFTDVTAEYETAKNGMRVFHAGETGKTFHLEITASADAAGTAIAIAIDDTTDATAPVLKITLPGKTKSATPAAIITEFAKLADKKGFNIQKAGTGAAKVEPITGKVELKLAAAVATDTYYLSEFKYDKTELYNNITALLAQKTMVLPPSSSVAGVYATTDRDRGVWKAPANHALAGVVEPAVKITDAIQENMNADSTSGKSINAIRGFAGKGTLVWGARTLAGNDNEWRYIPVRRLFNYIEESIRKATAFAVFEPNTPMTWLKVRTMASGFLEGLWQQGALAGADPAAAFFVNVGLGQTMTQQDVLEGRLLVEIGVAAVRPAEFIVLKFSHKLQ